MPPVPPPTPDQAETTLSTPTRGLPQEPRYLDEHRYRLGSGIRAVASYYHLFKGLEFVTRLLADNLQNGGDVNQVFAFCQNVTLSAWKATEANIFNSNELDNLLREGPEAIVTALNNVSTEFGHLKSLTSRLWNCFYRYAGGNTTERDRIDTEVGGSLDTLIYEPTVRDLVLLVSSRNAGSSNMIEPLDTIVSRLVSRADELEQIIGVHSPQT